MHPVLLCPSSSYKSSGKDGYKMLETPTEAVLQL